MARRLDEDDRSAFFFFGSFTPPELANFNVQNIFLGDGGVIEMMGPGSGISSLMSQPRRLLTQKCPSVLSRPRKPSHLTSKAQPPRAGMAPDRASIGCGKGAAGATATQILDRC
jgi:hypothetical protein